MRETFVNAPPTLTSYDEVHNLEDQSIVVSFAPPNRLQDSEQKQVDKDDMDKNEELTSLCENSEPSLHNVPITPAEIESKDNAHGAALMDGEASFDVLNSSTNDAFIEQLLVEPSLDLSLSHDDLLDIPCDNEELCDNAYVLHDLDPNTCAEIKHIIHIASTNDELKLLSSLHTLGSIEFADLCNLDCLDERLFRYADLPWFSRHTYHVSGKYDNNGQYMIHRVYICANLNFSSVVQHFDQLKGYNNNNIVMPCSSSSKLNNPVDSKEGEDMFLVSTNLL